MDTYLTLEDSSIPGVPQEVKPVSYRGVGNSNGVARSMVFSHVRNTPKEVFT